MPNYIFRPDRGNVEKFDAVHDDAARDYVLDLLFDAWAEDGDGGSLYRVDDGGRGDEEFVAEVRVGDGDGDDGDEAKPCYWRQGWPID